MKVVLFVLQFFLFLAVFGVGSFLPGVHLMPMWVVSAGASRNFVLDGLVLASVLLLVILAAEAARSRLRSACKLTALAYVLAVMLGFAMKFGLIQKPNVPYAGPYHTTGGIATQLS